ncbi:hemolysin III family protein [Sporichthya sp.]|uniref:PAQR family membrane homeostasis protein TrhA n=1 Tax=Sporichthya sp. TaxID=65475 RepID=UPI0017DB2572|nr:hemolysin III family protein [Sporichthya sp.]MBA3743159.1 hemolysin III family protein [Sporichthya sp.]
MNQVLERVEAAVKPHLRGWLHLGTFPVSLIAGFVLVAIPQEPRARLASAIFAVTASLLFGVSALYHRGNWGPRTTEVLKRLDHANIFLIIAGSYTPFALLLLSDSRATLMLAIVWTGAILGVLLRSVWINSARWLSAPVYIALGWTAVFFVPDLLDGGVATFVLICVGGGLYTAGGIVYGLKRPNPSPRWFGFHEVFHSFTVVGWIVHYVAVSIVAYTYG